MNLKNLLDGAFHVIFARRLGMEYLHRESTTRDRKARRIAIEVGKLYAMSL